MSHSYEYPRPALTVDVVVFGVDENDLKVLLIQRGLPPYEGSWALPGGFVQENESVEDAALRELREETGVARAPLEQYQVFSDPERDPRGWVVSVAFLALVRLSSHRVQAATDARDAAWFPTSDMPSLAFDHESIVSLARERLRERVQRRPVGFDLLPKKFTLTQLQRMYEKVLERALDKRNFRKKVLSMDILIELDEVQKDVAHRAARLYSFDRTRYREAERRGLVFGLG
ncbi:MAG: NUDIX domain-containing protein [Acidobacteriota bacterium]